MGIFVGEPLGDATMGLFFYFAGFLNRKYPLNIVAELTKIRQQAGKCVIRGFPAVGNSYRLLSAKIMAPFAVLAIMLPSVVAISVSAYELGEFPGKGDYQVWRTAGQIYNSGIDLGEARKYDQSIAKFQTAIAMYSYDPRYYFSLAVSYDGRSKPGDLNRAESALLNAIKLYPKDWRSWAYLADVIYTADQKRANESIVADQKALLLNPPASAVAKIKENIAKFQSTHAKVIGNR